MRVLQIMDSMGLGGYQTFVLNVYRNTDKTQIQFDFLLFKKLDNDNEKEIKSLGGNLYFLPGRHDGIIKNRLAVDKFFKQHKYDVVHFHASSCSYVYPLISATKNKVKVRIIHSHSSSLSLNNRIHRILHKVHKQRITAYANTFLACGEKALDWFYKNTSAYNKAQIINNGINICLYKKDKDKNKQIRNELNIKQDSFVLGHVGRFSLVKNHDYILSVFEKIYDSNHNSYLVLVGDGERFEEIKNKVNQMHCAKNILLLGIRNDVYLVLQTFDAFILPSLYEGFPIAAIEAQATGMPCFLSDTITDKVKINDNVYFLSINDKPETWAKKINNQTKTCIVSNKMQEFDIQTVVDRLMQYYTITK